MSERIVWPVRDRFQPGEWVRNRRTGAVLQVTDNVLTEPDSWSPFYYERVEYRHLRRTGLVDEVRRMKVSPEMVDRAYGWAFALATCLVFWGLVALLIWAL